MSIRTSELDPLPASTGFNIVSWVVRATFAAISLDDFSAYSIPSRPNLTFFRVACDFFDCCLYPCPYYSLIALAMTSVIVSS